ncbi:MAG: HEAT repeat domain-containing protein [Elusimicrobiota bacterium]
MKKIINILFISLLISAPLNLFAEFELLKSEDPSERSREALRLGSEKIMEAVPALIELLKDELTGPRINAIVALGQIGDKRAIEPLIDILNNDSVETARAMAAEALAGFDTEIVKRELLKAADTGSENVRSSAVGSLGRSGSDEELGKLIEKADTDPDWSVRVAAVNALLEYAGNNSEDKKIIKKTVKKSAKDKDERVKKAARRVLDILERKQ